MVQRASFTASQALNRAILRARPHALACDAAFSKAFCCAALGVGESSGGLAGATGSGASGFMGLATARLPQQSTMSLCLAPWLVGAWAGPGAGGQHQVLLQGLVHP